MASFKHFIKEMAMAQAGEVETDEVMESLKDLGDTPILWRGQTAGRNIGRMVIQYAGVVKIIMSAESFKGAMDSRLPDIIAKLGFKKKPVFCTFDKKQTKLFGKAGAVIPTKPFTMFWHDDIRDLLVDIKGKDVDELVNTYHKSVNKIKPGHTGEILIDCDEYYWITIDKFFEFASKSKYNQYKSIDDIKTYKDIYEVYKSYKSYLKWYKGRQQ